MIEEMTLAFAREANAVFTEQLFNDLLKRHFMQQHAMPSLAPIGNAALYVIRGVCPVCGKRRPKRNRCILSRCRKCKWKPRK